MGPLSGLNCGSLCGGILSLGILFIPPQLTAAGCAIPFGLALIAALKGEAAAQTVADQIVIR